MGNKFFKPDWYNEEKTNETKEKRRETKIKYEITEHYARMQFFSINSTIHAINRNKNDLAILQTTISLMRVNKQGRWIGINRMDSLGELKKREITKASLLSRYTIIVCKHLLICRYKFTFKNGVLDIKLKKTQENSGKVYYCGNCAIYCIFVTSAIIYYNTAIE